jgi:hypothetical protein
MGKYPIPHAGIHLSGQSLAHMYPGSQPGSVRFCSGVCPETPKSMFANTRTSVRYDTVSMVLPNRYYGSLLYVKHVRVKVFNQREF